MSRDFFAGAAGGFPIAGTAETGLPPISAVPDSSTAGEFFVVAFLPLVAARSFWRRD